MNPSSHGGGRAWSVRARALTWAALAAGGCVPAVHAADDTLEEVVVSARKRAERAQDVPISLSEISGAELQQRGLVRVQDILRDFPNVATDIISPRQASAAIRGLGRNPANEALESSVGVFLDGVYLGRPGMMVGDLVDLESIEVLRGPQGALFGKNATAGVINITSARPSADPGGWLEVTAGDFELREMRGAASGPLGGSAWSWRVSGFATHRDGFTYATARDEWLGELNRAGARGQLQWQPGADLSLRLIADYGSQDEIGPGYLLVDPNLLREDGSARTTNLVTRAERFGYVPEVAPTRRRNDADGRQRLTTENAGATLLIDWKLGELDFSSITGWRKFNHIPLNDGDYSALDVVPRAGVMVFSSQLSQELRLASPADGSFQYMAGVQVFGQQVDSNTVIHYGSDASGYLYPGLPAEVLDGFHVFTDSDPETRSYSAFGQMYWWPRGDLEIAAGVRWTTEEKDAFVEQRTEGGALLAFGDIAASEARRRLGFAQSFSVRSDEDFISGSFSATWHYDEHANAYVSVARGAKSGGVNAAILPPGADLTIDPEIALGFEAGIKTQWLEERLQVNAAAFRTTIDGYQASIRDRVVGASYLANAGEVHSNGFEVEANYRPVPGLTLSGNAGYNDAHYESFRNSACPPELDNQPSCDFTGERVAGAPPLTYGASLDYDTAFGSSRLRLRTAMEYSHSDGYRAELSRSTWIPAHDLVNARAGVRTADEALALTLWVQNLFDEDYYSGMALVGPSGTGLSLGLLGTPRTMGLSIQLRY